MINAVNNYPSFRLDLLSSDPSGGAGSAIAPTNTAYGRINSSTTQTNGSNRAITLPAGFSFSSFHRYGVLWTPTFIGFYLDNQLVGMPSGVNPINANSSPAYSAFSPEASTTLASNVGGCDLIIGTGGNTQMIVQSVGVWQS